MPVTGMTLHTAHCTVCTAPEPIPAPEIAPLHFILHIKHCTVHNRHLYFTLHTYQKLAEFKLMLLAEKWTLIYPVVRCMNYLPHCKSMDYWSLINRKLTMHIQKHGYIQYTPESLMRGDMSLYKKVWNIAFLVPF